MTVEDLKKHWSKGVDLWAKAEIDPNMQPITRKMASDRKAQLLICIQELELLNVEKNTRP